MQKPQAKDAVAGLVAKFDSNLADYKRTTYKETQVRIDFIDPFFFALGWDIANRQGLREDLREVIHEDTLEIEGRKRAPDYSFRLPNGEVAQHDRLVEMVEQMLALHQKVATAGNPADKKLYQRQIAMTDRAIDSLVYASYGLSEEEIGIVEGS